MESDVLTTTWINMDICILLSIHSFTAVDRSGNLHTSQYPFAEVDRYEGLHTSEYPFVAVSLSMVFNIFRNSGGLIKAHLAFTFSYRTLTHLLPQCSWPLKVKIQKEVDNEASLWLHH